MYEKLVRLVYFYKQNLSLPGLKIIREVSFLNSGIIFTKFSPLAPLFYEFSIHQWGNGIYDKLTLKWFGNQNNIPEPITDGISISYSQTFICFLFLLCIMVLSIMLLFGELLCNFTKKDLRNKEIEIVEKCKICGK